MAHLTFEKFLEIFNIEATASELRDNFYDRGHRSRSGGFEIIRFKMLIDALILNVDKPRSHQVLHKFEQKM